MTQVSESERRQVYGDLNMFYPTVSMLYTDEQEMLAGAQTIHELGEKVLGQALEIKLCYNFLVTIQTMPR